jgi:hypothetical protein
VKSSSLGSQPRLVEDFERWTILWPGPPTVVEPNRRNIRVISDAEIDAEIAATREGTGIATADNRIELKSTI